MPENDVVGFLRHVMSQDGWAQLELFAGMLLLVMCILQRRYDPKFSNDGTVLRMVGQFGIVLQAVAGLAMIMDSQSDISSVHPFAVLFVLATIMIQVSALIPILAEHGVIQRIRAH